MPRRTTATFLIAVFAFAVTGNGFQSATVCAESWFSFRKSESSKENSSGVARTGSAKTAAHRASTKSQATTPTESNRRVNGMEDSRAVVTAAPEKSDRPWWSWNKNKKEAPSKESQSASKARSDVDHVAQNEKSPARIEADRATKAEQLARRQDARRKAEHDSQALAAESSRRSMQNVNQDQSGQSVATESDNQRPIGQSSRHRSAQHTDQQSVTRSPVVLQPRIEACDEHDLLAAKPSRSRTGAIPSARTNHPTGLRHVAFEEEFESQVPTTLPLLRGETDSNEVVVPVEKTLKQKQIQLKRSEKSDELISLTVRNAPLAIVLSMIAEQHGLNLVAGGEIDGQVTVTLNDVELEDAFNALLTANGYSWHRNKNILVISKVGGEKRAPEVRGVVLRVFRLNFVSAQDIEKVVQGLLSPGGQAVTTIIDSKDVRRTREEIVVEDLPEYVARIEAYIRDVDVPPRQVLVKARVLQVTLSDDMRHGVNFDSIIKLAGSEISLKTKGFANPAASPAFFLGLDSGDLDALVEALQVTTDAKTLASPEVFVLNGQHARIQIGQQLGFLVTTTTQTSTLQNVNFLDVGVVLNVTPTITDDGRVMMVVKPEVSGGRINLQGLPEEDTTEVETTVMLDDGQGMVIGGLLKEEDIDKQNKIPFFGNLWVVGRLFQRRTLTRTRTEVIIALSAHIAPYTDEISCEGSVKLDRVTTPLLYGPLERMDRRQWEEDLFDATRRPRHLKPPTYLNRLHDDYLPRDPASAPTIEIQGEEDE